jgi:uncharacterized protein (DUF1800 family)
MRKRIVIALLVLAGVFSQAAAAPRKNVPKKLTPKVLSDREKALHVLDRFAFGPRPGDIQKVLEMGTEKWFEQQLQPSTIPNAAVDARLNQLTTLKMQPRELVETFPPPPVIRQIAEGKKPIPADAQRAGLYEVLVDRYNEDKNMTVAASMGMTPSDAAKKAAEAKAQDDAQHLAQMLLSMPREKRISALMLMPVSDRRTLAANLRGELHDKLFAEFSPTERETVLAMNGPAGVVITELQQGKLLRAIYSERQLEEVMTDFWFNHFNIFLNKDADQYLVTSYERDVIHPRVFGKFRDLLIATAHSPAMLFYLDNWTSIGPNSPAANGGKPPKPGAPPNPQRGLNENYARELMELHTLGVDGGYGQHDVTEVARVFTGWTIQQPELGGAFQFDSRRHEPGDKIILGQVIKAGGEDEGLQVLEMLARSPATANFISTKLARRFVSDDPPKALIERMAETFLSSDGDIREVLRTMFHSKEFWSPDVYQKKVKTPLEFVASAIRATGTEIGNPQPLVGAMARMGMPLYQMQPPTGYPTAASAWLNSDALLDRMNFALMLSSGKLGGAKFDPSRVLALGVLTEDTREETVAGSGLERAISLVEGVLVGGEVSEQTRTALRKQMQDPQISDHLLDDPNKPLGMAVALILGSPEFQRR